MPWEAIPFDAPVLTNVDETALRNQGAAIENGFITEAKHFTRFPGLSPFTSLGAGRVYLDSHRGDMIAVTSGGQFFRIDQSGTAEEMTGAAVAGGGRPTFAHTEDDLLVAAGAAIIRFTGTRTAILSNDAPESSHIGYVDGYTVALEPRSGRFWNSALGHPDQWDALDVFAATGKPSDIRSLFVTPFNELLLCSEISSEQFEQSPQADLPFFRRWLAGEGIKAPYTICWEDNAAWLVNQKSEFIRLSGQLGQVESFPVQQTLERIDDWSEAWMVRLPIMGQRFILLQAPHATNVYGTAGVTLLHDVRTGRWSTLYGWDPVQLTQVRWPGWSYLRLWDRDFVGGEGVIYELKSTNYQSQLEPMPTLLRTGHLDAGGTPFRIDNLQLRMKRGTATAAQALLSIRANKDNKGFGRWKRVEVGRPGDFWMRKQLGAFGCCHSVQFEILLTDSVELELVALEWQRTPLQ